MEQKAEATRLVSDDRVSYLVTPDTWGTLEHATLVREGSLASVATWTGHSHSRGVVTLGLRKGPFYYQENILPTDARLLAQAILMAAEDAEKAIDAAYAKQKAIDAAYAKQKAIDAAYAKQMAEDDEVPA